MSPQKIDYFQIKDCNPLSLNYFSDFIIGMFSNMVIEAMLMGKKVLRVQIEQKGSDLLKYNNTSASLIKDQDKLIDYLTSIL